MMRTFYATVRGGRLTLDEPTDLPDGTPVELMLIEDASNGEPDEEEQASLNRTGDLTFDTVTDEHIRLYQESMPASPRTRDVITAATSNLHVLRWLGRRQIAATINARAKAVK